MAIPLSFNHYQSIHNQKKPIRVEHWLAWHKRYEAGNAVPYLPSIRIRGGRGNYIVFDEAMYIDGTVAGNTWESRRR